MSQDQSTLSLMLSPPIDHCCPLCHVGLRKRLAGIPGDPTEKRFAVKKCTNCGLGQTQPRPLNMDLYYHASDYGNRHRLTNRISVRRRLVLARSRVGAGTSRNLLDFGCGDSTFLVATREEGWNCCGVERNPPTSVPLDLPVVGSLDELGLT
jgi:hypothetical protein